LGTGFNHGTVKKIRKVIQITLAVVASALLILIVALWLRPPDLIRVGANYTAKIVCSNVFLAGREPEEVLRTDVQAPGHPLLRIMRVSVDRERGVVRAGLFGFIGGGLAVVRPGTGCAVLPDGVVPTASGNAAAPLAGTEANAGTAATAGTAVSADSAVGGESAATPLASSGDSKLGSRPAQPGMLWPEGDAVQTDATIDHILADDTLAGPGMRAIVVVHDGQLVGERYAEGFGPQTPQLGWSMTKSVMAGLIGILVKDGGLSLTQPVGAALHWSGADPRAKITIADLLAMSSGLHFNEEYGAVSDVTRMLYLEPDMAAFASAQPLAHPPGTVWSYSSGSTVILSRVFQRAAGSDALTFVGQRLFEPLGMTSAVIETDEHGTLVGSSYLYATPRDWARYGQMLSQDGIWQGQEILPRGYVSMMAAPVVASGGEYGRGLVWRWAMDPKEPGENPDAAFGIPADAFWMMGHDGQSVTIIPSKHVVVVRMGLTPEREHYQPEPLVQAILSALDH